MFYCLKEVVEKLHNEDDDDFYDSGGDVEESDDYEVDQPVFIGGDHTMLEGSDSESHDEDIEPNCFMTMISKTDVELEILTALTKNK